MILLESWKTNPWIQKLDKSKTQVYKNSAAGMAFKWNMGNGDEGKGHIQKRLANNGLVPHTPN